MDPTPSPQPEPVAAVPEWEAATVALVALYAALNRGLLIDYARILRSTPATDAGADGLLTRLRHVTRAHLVEVSKRVGSLITRLCRGCYEDGIKHATRAYRDGGGSGHPNHFAGIMSGHWRTHAEQSIEVIRASLVDDVRVVHAQVLRAPDDLYRAIVAAKAQALVGDIGKTPQMAQAEAFGEFVAKGVIGYTDRTGREWPLGAYTEMAVRTAAQRAYNVAYQDQLKALGVTLYKVPDDGHACPLCWPWQNHVLSDLPDARPWVKGTVDEARAAGLFHPQCRHVLLPYFEGITFLSHPKPWGPEQQAAYAATQRLRTLERRVRQQKDVMEHAVEPAIRQRAKANVTRTQKAIRAHVEQYHLVRRSHRESRPQ